MPRHLLSAIFFCLNLVVFAEAGPKPDLVVAMDGSGDFKTIQAAVASISPTNRERVVVFIKDGIYREKTRVKASFVTLRGESRKGTRIEFAQLNDDFTKNPDDLGRAVINLDRADDFVLENLTAENTADQIGPHAFTIYGTGDRTVIVDCDVLSHGADTVSLWLGQSGRYYHARCRFQGSVDFVCPRGWCYVTDCTFYEMKDTAAVWHDGKVSPDMKFVLRNCKFDGAEGFNLARHHADAQFYFLDCTFSKTMADRPVRRVIYPLSGAQVTEADIKKNRDNDKSNLWGERVYFYDCHRDGGDYAWFTNNLSTATNSPAPEQITPAWTFAGKWNPENKSGPEIRLVRPQDGKITITFSEPVTVKGNPRLRFSNGGFARYVSGSGAEALIFETAADPKPDTATSLDLNGGAIIASEASAAMRNASLAMPRNVEGAAY